MTSFFSRMSTEMSNAITDAYSNYMYGDDAGKSAKLVYIARPDSNGRVGLDDITFININNRAYVSKVEQDSVAADLGVRSQDALQFAVILSITDDKIPPQALKSEAFARDWAFDMEQKGQRTSYKELRSIIRLRTEGDGAVLMVFRRTRKRAGNKFSGGGPPMGLPSFRMDEECDRAASLIRKLAPVSEQEIDEPTAWDELYHDTKELFFGSSNHKRENEKLSTQHARVKSGGNDESSSTVFSIPQDTFEAEFDEKAAKMKDRMKNDRRNKDEDVEAATIRDLIKSAVGLAFIRVSKVVLGISIHGGTGIVIARLSDGTWSAPSAIGSIGGGLGLQFGVEVADFLLILQTNDALGHFRRGGNFTIGGNVGCAIAGIGREAFGAASFKGSCIPTAADLEGPTLEIDSSSEVAPIVAYARSQGIYLGVSLEGSKLFTRDDINERSYKFITGADVIAGDVLSGKIDTPPEAEGLYAALHSIEFNSKVKSLPSPPKVLLKDVRNEWRCDISNVSAKSTSERDVPFSFMSSINDEDAEELAAFETKFKKFMYGGVSVQKLVTDVDLVNGITRRERRTLWLMLPDIGSLRLGYISKVDDAIGGSPSHSPRHQGNRRTYDDDEDSYYSEGASTYVTEDSGLYTNHTEDYTYDDYTIDGTVDGSIISRQRNIRLSMKHSIPLTSVISLSQEPNVSIRFNPDDATEHLRVVNVDDGNGTTLLFLANNVQEAELLTCGLKLLLERETSRLGVRGGIPTNKVSMESNNQLNKNNDVSKEIEDRDHRSDDSLSDTSNRFQNGNAPIMKSLITANVNEETRPPGVLRSSSIGDRAKYVLGKDVTENVVSNVSLPFPFALCRVLLLDSSSPVIVQWEANRGDKNFEKGKWTFPPGTRDQETYNAEHQLLSKDSMVGAHRTISFDRRRNGTYVRLSETHIVDIDNADTLSLNIVERLPRRGFAVKVCIYLKLKSPHSCDASIWGEIRPVGKNLFNQDAVHKAFGMVIDEINLRYGTCPKGLLDGLIKLIKSLPTSTTSTRAPPVANGSSRSTSPSVRSSSSSQIAKNTYDKLTNIDKPTHVRKETIHSDNGEPSLQDILKAKRAAEAAINGHEGAQKREPPTSHPTRTNHPPSPARPSTPSFKTSSVSGVSSSVSRNRQLTTSKLYKDNGANDNEQFIEVKPLPKIRLSLMPSPREVDEDSTSQEGFPSSTTRIARAEDDILSTRRVTEWPEESNKYSRGRRFN